MFEISWLKSVPKDGTRIIIIVPVQSINVIIMNSRCAQIFLTWDPVASCADFFRMFSSRLCPLPADPKYDPLRGKVGMARCMRGECPVCTPQNTAKELCKICPRAKNLHKETAMISVRDPIMLLIFFGRLARKTLPLSLLNMKTILSISSARQDFKNCPTNFASRKNNSLVL